MRFSQAPLSYHLAFPCTWAGPRPALPSGCISLALTWRPHLAAESGRLCFLLLSLLRSASFLHLLALTSLLPLWCRLRPPSPSGFTVAALGSGGSPYGQLPAASPPAGLSGVAGVSQHSFSGAGGGSPLSSVLGLARAPLKGGAMAWPLASRAWCGKDREPPPTVLGGGNACHRPCACGCCSAPPHRLHTPQRP